MFTAVVVDQCTTWMEWPVDEAASAFIAALTMNVSMTALQDVLAEQSERPSPTQQQEIDTHALRSADILEAAGIGDQVWLGAVRNHHLKIKFGGEIAGLQPVARLSQLLHRVDIFTAKLSRRRSRSGLSATSAARDACLDHEGQLDAIGATILRVLGLYPPGSIVQLVDGEIAIVTRRGDKAHMPIAVGLRRADGSVLVNLRRRDTSDLKHRVVRGAKGDDLTMAISHDRVLACG
jgi:HD-GYP domain-containing protein (c-di-GMP phosphodiesterase class II)